MAGTADRRPWAALGGSLPGGWRGPCGSGRFPGPPAAGRPRAASRRPIAHSCPKPCAAPGLGSVLPARLASRSHHVGKRGCYSGGPATPGHPAVDGSLKGGCGPGDLGQSLPIEGQAGRPGLGTPEGHWPHSPATGQQTPGGWGRWAWVQSRGDSPLPEGGSRGPLPSPGAARGARGHPRGEELAPPTA